MDKIKDFALLIKKKASLHMAPAGMLILFILSQFVAALIAPSFQEEGFQTFEDPDNPLNILYIFSVIIVFTLIILVIAKYKENYVKYIILLFFFLASISIFEAFFYFLLPNYALHLGLIVGAFMLLLLVIYPEWYVIDIFGVFLAGGIAAIFSISLSVELILIFLVLLSFYDLISVFKTKHMITLAESLTSSQLPLLMIIPKKATFSYLRPQKITHQKDAIYMGLGDFIIPGWLIAYSYLEYGSLGFLLTLCGAIFGYLLLMSRVRKGPQPGLPYLNGGAIIGFAILLII